MTAPIVMFVYNRLNLIKETVNSLKNNDIAKDSVIYFFSDGPKNDDDIKPIEAVREYLKEIKSNKYFKEVNITCADKNKGITNSVVDGVTHVLKKHGKAIMIEDDVVTTSGFLSYMNEALEFYKDDKNIGTIAGVSSLNDISDICKDDVFFACRNCSCAWATWYDRWMKVDWKVSDYNKFRLNLIKRKKFNTYGQDLSSMLDLQMIDNSFDAWDIMLEYSLFKNNMYTVFPSVTKASSIGAGSGVHYKNIKVNRDTVKLPDNEQKDIKFVPFNINKGIIKRYKDLYKRRTLSKILTFVERVVFRKNKISSAVMRMYTSNQK